MKKVFSDSNVLLDLLLDREPFNDDTAGIEYSISEADKICVSSITITGTNYIIGGLEGVKSANKKTKIILDLVTVENVGESTVLKSSNSRFKDFEDSVQNFCAIESEHKIIVTRNVQDFKASELSIMTSKGFLVKLM